MLRHCSFGFMMLLACCFLEVSSRPSNNELTTPKEVLTDPKDIERSLTYDVTDTKNEPTIIQILDKIKAVNDNLQKPNKLTPYHPPPASDYSLDKETWEKLQQAIASGKLGPYPQTTYKQESNSINNLNDLRYSRQLAQYLSANQAQMAVQSTPYLINMPVLVMPPMNNMYNYGNSMDYATKSLTKEGPTSPFPTFPTLPAFPTLPTLPPFQWPFASLFPILIRDPLLSIMNGGGWNNFIEYGQSADVCRKQKSKDQNIDDEDFAGSLAGFDRAENIFLYPSSVSKTRQKRAVKKRTVNHASQLQEIDPKLNNFFGLKPTTAKPKPAKADAIKQDTKTNFANDGDVRIFDFLSGNKYRQPTGPGFFINRLKVRRGGVAIAGPGGVATAGRGGTAIVGPGGLAYTQPGGLAVAGPAARIVALSSDADLTSVAHRLQEQNSTEEDETISGAGIDFNQMNTDMMEASVQYIPFYGGAKGQYLEIKKDVLGRLMSEKIVSEENLSSENIVKNKDENLLGKVMAANLQNLKTLSTSLLKLHNLGRKTGTLGNKEKARYKTQLASLGEAASNIIKLIEEVDDVEMLFRKNVTVRNKDEEDYDDYVAEEGVSIDASNDDSDFGESPEKSTVAEAKPVGLAVIGEHGIAASRPLATAVAASGIAIAKPIATAIAGINPADLGVNFQINHFGN